MTDMTAWSYALSHIWSHWAGFLVVGGKKNAEGKALEGPIGEAVASGAEDDNPTVGSKEGLRDRRKGLGSIEVGSRGHPPTLGLPSEVILDTQFNLTKDTRSNIYKDILASIGLDSPTTSNEDRAKSNNVGGHQFVHGQSMNTPIRNTASNLLALGQHVMTLRQERLWNSHPKSPLGRH